MAQYINTQNPDANKQVVMKFVRGVDQVAAETGLPSGSARRIVNYDVHQGVVTDNGILGGRLSARSRVERVITGTNVHSLWSGEANTCFVMGGDLVRLWPDYTTTVVHAGVGNEPMYYTELAGVVYYSNGALTGKVVNGAYTSWGMANPSAPVVTATPNGGLAAGTYQVACTYRSTDSTESGASGTTVVQVAEGGGIQVSILASSYVTRIYVSQTNGDNLYWAQDIPAALTTAFIGTHTPGKLLATQFMRAPEPCKFLELYNGRIYGAVGNTLVMTQAMNYDLTKPATDFFMFPEDITMVKCVVDGLYVGTATGVSFLGGIDSGELRNALVDMLPPIPGSALSVDGALFGDPGKGVVWLTRRGWVFGGDGGRIKRLTESQMAIPDYDRAASLYREHDGMRQLMTFVRGGGEAAGASDSYDIEIVRNGQVL